VASVGLMILVLAPPKVRLSTTPSRPVMAIEPPGE
jgi:hypothetical protein